MTESEFAEIIASALIMVLRAINKRYHLKLWVLTRDEKRQIEQAISNCDDGKIMISKISHLFHVDN